MKNPDNTRFYGDLASAVYVAPKGTTGPTDLDTPTGFEELGWLSEDGITFDRDEDVTVLRAYQGATVVRRKTNSVDDSFSFQCLEETATVLGLHYKGQEAEVTGSGDSAVARINLTDQARQDDRAFVVDVVDGNIVKRHVIPSGSVGTGSLTYANGEATVYEFTVSINGNDAYILTNNPAITGQDN